MTWDIVSTIKRKARKSHKCCECNGEIEKGQTYELTEGKWEGDWQSFKRCLECSLIVDAIHKKDNEDRFLSPDYEGVCFGQLGETLHELRDFQDECYMPVAMYLEIEPAKIQKFWRV